MKSWISFLLFLSVSLFSQTATPPSAGDGSSGNPYQIATLNNLYWLIDHSWIWRNDLYYIQTADIDASSTEIWFDGQGWLPVGNTDYVFNGTYDGNGKKITGLYINRPTTSRTGFFGNVLNGYIHDLILENVNINGAVAVGALAGYNDGSTVLRCSVNGSVTGTNNIGGLVGYSCNGSSISESSSSCTVNGTDYVGCLAGLNSASLITDCYAKGVVSGARWIGGLLGLNNTSATVHNCYAASEVSGTLYYIGGVVAYNDLATSAVVQYVFFDSEISGYGSSQGCIAKTTAQMKDITTYMSRTWDFVGETVNGTDDYWDINSTDNDGYPYLSWQFGPSGIDQDYSVSECTLYQNYPNPFNPVTAISYALLNTSQVELNVYNLNGQLVNSLVNGKMGKGSHKIEFNGADLTSGMYVYNLKVDGKFVLSRKMMLLK